MRRTTITAIALAAILSLAGCSASGAADAGSYEAPRGVPAPAGGVSVQEDGTGGGVSFPDGTTSDEATRQVVTTGSMTVTADDPLTAAEDAVGVVEGAGGRVDARSEQAAGQDQPASAQLTLRIPADSLQDVIDDLKALGRADRVTLGSDDVTRASQDLDARISALRASIERLTAMIANATETDDLIALETAISDRQAQLESMEAQQRDLADQVAMATISLELRSPAGAPRTGPGDFLAGVGAGWDAFLAFWVGFSVVLGVALPWLLTLGVIALAVWAIVRFVVRRRPAAPAE